MKKISKLEDKSIEIITKETQRKEEDSDKSNRASEIYGKISSNLDLE